MVVKHLVSFWVYVNNTVPMFSVEFAVIIRYLTTDKNEFCLAFEHIWSLTNLGKLAVLLEVTSNLFFEFEGILQKSASPLIVGVEASAFII